MNPRGIPHYRPERSPTMAKEIDNVNGHDVFDDEIVTATDSDAEPTPPSDSED